MATSARAAVNAPESRGQIAPGRSASSQAVKFAGHEERLLTGGLLSLGLGLRRVRRRPSYGATGAQPAPVVPIQNVYATCRLASTSLSERTRVTRGKIFSTEKRCISSARLEQRSSTTMVL